MSMTEREWLNYLSELECALASALDAEEEACGAVDAAIEAGAADWEKYSVRSQAAARRVAEREIALYKAQEAFYEAFR